MMKSTRDTIMTVLKADPSVTREEREDVEVALGGRVRPKVRTALICAEASQSAASAGFTRNTVPAPASSKRAASLPHASARAACRPTPEALAVPCAR